MKFPTFLSRKNIASPSELGDYLDIKYLSKVAVKKPLGNVRQACTLATCKIGGAWLVGTEIVAV